MTPWESLLQSNNGSSIIKQLALIAFFILEYIYIYIYVVCDHEITQANEQHSCISRNLWNFSTTHQQGSLGGVLDFYAPIC